MNKIYSKFAFALLFSIVFVSCSKKLNSGEAEVVRIVDGDTFVINFNGEIEKVRLIGVDTPESKRNRKAKRDAAEYNENLDDIISMGKEAAAYVKTLIEPDKIVKVEFDVQERDQYGRLLCYVYLRNGKMLNKILVEEGYAQVYTFPPNVKYQDLFLAAQHFARENNKGFWNKSSY